MKNKKIALYSNAYNTSDGGGIAYILAIAKMCNLKGYQITIFFNNSLDLKEIKERYEISNLKICILQKRTFPLLAQMYYAIKEYFEFDIVFEQSTIVPRLTFAKKSYIICDFPFDKADNLSKKMRLKSWKTIVANSEFTKLWIENNWKRESKVLHPPITSPNNFNNYKTLDIVSIGRFTSGGRSKNQDIIISVFKELIKLGYSNINLHLLGYVQDENFLEKLKKEAIGFPVFFYENSNIEIKNKILNQSSFFISACGYGVDELQFPYRLEHYGISVVEAMAYGCIPLVVENGGPKETVDNAINGIHWNTKGELINAIVMLIKNEKIRKEMSNNAFLKSTTYSFTKLEENFREILN